MVEISLFPRALRLYFGALMSNTKLIAINVGILIGGLLVWKIVTHWSEWSLPVKFVVFMLLIVVVGVPVIASIVPRIGDRIGDFFYSAPERVEQDPYTKVAVKVTQGDYEGAIDGYRNIAKTDPGNRFPVVEISKIQLEHLEDLESAITTLQIALGSGEYGDNGDAFFIFRLAELYLEEKEDTAKAKEYLQSAIERFPDTRFSANATHKLHEIDQTAFHR